MASLAPIKKIILVVLLFLFLILGAVFYFFSYLNKPIVSNKPITNDAVSDTTESPFGDLSKPAENVTEIHEDYTKNAFSISGLTSLPEFTGDPESWESLLYKNQYVADVECNSNLVCSLNFIVSGAENFNPILIPDVDMKTLCPSNSSNILVDTYVYGYLDNVTLASYLDRKIQGVFTFAGNNVFIDGLEQPEWCVFYVK